MQEANALKNKISIEKKISDKLKGINEQSRNYIKDVIELINREIGVNKILSLVLFGSQRAQSNERTTVSDCDLLLIFKDRVSNRHIKEMEKYFISLEIKHNFREVNSGLVNHILEVIQQTTGIFVSHFLTKKRYWDQVIFHKIFRVNKVFSTIFAPRNIVLANVISNSTILYGDDLRNKIKPKIRITIFEIFRSTVMNLMISFFSILLTLFKNVNSIKYQLEAIKWTLKASNYYCFRDSENLNKIVNRFISLERPKSKGRAKKFFSDFLYLRKSPQSNFNFMIRAPFRILKIHIKAILFKKIYKNRRESKKIQKIIKPLMPGRSFPLRF